MMLLPGDTLVRVIQNLAEVREGWDTMIVIGMVYDDWDEVTYHVMSSPKINFLDLRSRNWVWFSTCYRKVESWT
jgi:hypothetical protein